MHTPKTTTVSFLASHKLLLGRLLFNTSEITKPLRSLRCSGLLVYSLLLVSLPSLIMVSFVVSLLLDYLFLCGVFRRRIYRTFCSPCQDSFSLVLEFVVVFSALHLPVHANLCFSR